MIRPHAAKMDAGWLHAGLAVLAIGAVGCSYTTTNVVTMRALETQYPVSASSAYIDARGDTVDNYVVLNAFKFDHSVEAARHSKSESPIGLEPKLNEIVGKVNGDAITNLQITPIDYTSGSHASAARAKEWGWFLMTTGILLAGTWVTYAIVDQDTRGLTAAAGSSSPFLLSGGIGLAIGMSDKDPSVWHFMVWGNVVKDARAAVRAAPGAPGAPAEPAPLPGP